MNETVKTWIDCKIAGVGSRVGTNRLHVLISSVGPGVWEAKGLERRILARNGTPYAAYLELRNSLPNLLKVDPALGEYRRASVSSHQLFEDTVSLISLQTTVMVGRQRCHVVALLHDDGWYAATMEQHTVVPASRSPGEAYTKLSRLLHELAAKSSDDLRDPKPAPAWLWAQCESAGHETFGRPRVVFAG